MWFLRAYLKKYHKLLTTSLILATINQVFSLVNPQIFRLLIDDYATKVDELTQHEFLSWVWVLLLIWVGAAAVSRVAKTFQDYYVNLMSQKIGASIYADSIEHTFSLPYRVFEDWRSWSLLDKLQKARQDIQKFLQSMINTVFLTSIGMGIVMIYAFRVHRLIGTVFLAMVPLLARTTLYLSKRVRNAQKNIVRTSADLAGSTIENVKNVTLIKSLWLEAQEVKHLNTVNDQLIELEIEKLKLIKTITFSQGTLINFLRSLLQLIMLWLVFSGGISLWEFFTLLFYSFLLFNPLYELPTVATNLQELKASNEILEEIHALPVEAVPEQPVKINHIHSLQFTAVSFGYTPSTLAVQDISFTVNPWETVAFVWPSWAGKSTILKLLTWLYQPISWDISYNNISLNLLDKQWVKQHVSIVAQDTQLFSWTIKDNLRFVQPTASDEACRDALKAASLYEFVQQQPKWVDTFIGEWGLKLSWGQKQRLAIARALLREPDLLIFDEATSSLDSIVEWKITETIKWLHAFNPSLMTILVAHRLSTVMHADMIYVLEQGKIIETWNHADLLAEKWLYYALWRQQSGQWPVA